MPTCEGGKVSMMTGLRRDDEPRSPCSIDYCRHRNAETRKGQSTNRGALRNALL